MQTGFSVNKHKFSFLQGGGEMGELISNYHWNETSIGSPDQWPQSLRTTLNILLASKFPMFLWWGEDLIQFYNDAYRPSLGKDGKHPKALGQRGEDCWAEIWTVIKPLIDQVLAGGEAKWSEDQLIPIYRNGHIEDVYWTFSYSPVNDESGQPAGVLVTCIETAEKVGNRKKLEESKDQLRFAIEAAELGTWDYNPLTNTFSGNERLKDWFGLPPEAEIELTLAINVMVESDRQRVTEAIQRSLEYSSGGHYDIEYTIINPLTNKERIVRAKGKAWFGQDGIAYRFNGTLQDVTEQAIARKRIEESERRFRSLVEEATVATAVLTGRDMVLTLCNEAMLNIWQRDKSIIGKQLLEFMPELTNQSFPKLLDDVYTSGITYSELDALARLNRSGKLEDVYMDFSYKPLRNSAGETEAIMVAASDVTTRVMAHKKVEESEQQVRSFIEGAPFPIGVYVGKEMRIQFANQAILTAGGKGNDVIGRVFSEVLPELDNHAIFEQLDGVLTTGIPFHAKNQRVDLVVDGKLQPYYFNYSFTPLFDAQGNVYGVMNTAADVTDLNLAHKKIEEAEERARLAIESAELGTYEINLQTNEVVMSPRMSAIFDVENSSDRNRYITAIYPEDLKVREEAYTKAYQTGLLDYEIRIVRKDGSVSWVRVKGKIYYDKENIPVRLLGVAQDITEQKTFAEALAEKVEERTGELAKANGHLSSMNKELEQFTYAASHDMQEPLRKVQTFCSILLKRNSTQLDERGKNDLLRISTSVQRMKNIIDDLLNYSLQTREAQEFKPIDLNKTIEDIENDFELLIQQKKATVTKDVLPLINAVPEQMNQLFFNLFSNSLKFSKPDVPVQIVIKCATPLAEELSKKGIQTDQLYVKISFSDNGIGFQQEYAEQIFSLFKRLHGKNEYQGTGIGLGLCKKIVQNHNGVIWAESELGKGTTFNILLP